MVHAEDELKWLDTSTQQPYELLRPLESELMEAYPVQPLVNSWENEGPELIEPLTASGRPTEVQIGLPLS